MIGYIVSMTNEEILEEVNSYQRKYCIEKPEILHNSTNCCSQLYSHILERRRLKPEVFRLNHLWVDMRSG